MNNKIYISPFKDFKGHIQILKHDNHWMVTISNENEILRITDHDLLDYVNNTDNQWHTTILKVVQESTENS